jgi:hypothetical protein
MKFLLLSLILIVNSYGFQADNKSVLENFIRSEIDGHTTFSDIKCGTRYHMAVETNQDILNPKLYEQYIQSQSIAPVRQRSMISPSGFFKLHWDDSLTHAVPQEDLDGNGYPDYIDSAAVILDYVRDVEVGEMGYLPPPGDDGNELIPYPVYFTNHFKYGETIRVNVIQSNLPAITYTSHIHFDNDYSEYYFPTKGLDGLRVTAAHEYHHAIQLGYIYRPDDVYFFEMTSTWLEEYIYPEIDDYLYYLDYFFETVSNSRFDQISLTYPYANSIYLQMVESQFDASVIKTIWEKMRNDGSLTSTLEENNTTWYESLNEYGLWLYYTGDRAISNTFFSDAALFPEITIKSEDKIEFETAFVEDVNITEIANRYLEIQNVRGKILDIQVAGNEHAESGFRIMTPNSHSDANLLNTAITSDPIDSDQLVVVINNSEINEIINTTNIVLNGAIDLTKIYPFPNPVIAKEDETVRFQNVPPEADLHIFSTSGKRVARVEGQGSSRIRSWYLKTDDGNKVAAGIYFYLVQGDGILEKGKFSVIR